MCPAASATLQPAVVIFQDLRGPISASCVLKGIHYLNHPPAPIQSNAMRAGSGLSRDARLPLNWTRLSDALQI
jgi:hypothetical protein